MVCQDEVKILESGRTDAGKPDTLLLPAGWKSKVWISVCAHIRRGSEEEDRSTDTKTVVYESRERSSEAAL